MNWCQPVYNPGTPKRNAPVEAATGARSNTDESPDKPSETENNTVSVTVSAPEALRMLPGWLIWRSEQHEGEAKPRKVPYYAGSRQRRRGRQGEPEDRRQLVTFAEATAVAQSGNFSGVGFALMPEWGITALDFDNCVTDDLIDPAVEKLVGCTYAEYSPSGKGVRAFMRGTLKDKKSAGEPFGFETFCHKGFVTFTGRPLEICELIGAENTVADLTPEILELYESRFGLPDMPAVDTIELSPISLTVEQIKACLAALPKDLPYEASAGASWLGVGMALHHETQGSDVGFNLWDEWSATSPKYSSREYGEPKWRSFGRSDKSITGRSLVKWANEHGAQISFGVATADDFEAIEEPKAEPRKPRSAGEILAMQFAPLNWVVPKILPEGVYLLVASPKIGKSWLALQMALAVATGTDILGEKAEPGAALYLALEDNDRRLQARLRELDADLILSEHSAAALRFETEWPRAGSGGAEAIDAWIADNPDARLVIVDVLERFRPQRKAKGNLYAEDYEALRALKVIADKRRTAILVVHHTRKGNGLMSDPMEMVSGTQGLAGSADGMLMLERSRGESRGKLHVIGRDIEDDGEYVVEFAGCRWSMLGSARRVASTIDRQQILDVLNDFKSPMTAAQIAEAIGKSRTAVHNLLSRAVTEGVILHRDKKYLPAGGE